MGIARFLVSSSLHLEERNYRALTHSHLFITSLWVDVSFISMLNQLFKKYNQKNTLLVFSSYAQTSEAMRDQNALAWYTKHLVSTLPKNKQIVFLSEKTAENSNLPYEAAENILIIYTAY